MLTIRINNNHPITENSKGLLFEFVGPNTMIDTRYWIRGDQIRSNSTSTKGRISSNSPRVDNNPQLFGDIVHRNPSKYKNPQSLVNNNQTSRDWITQHPIKIVHFDKQYIDPWLDFVSNKDRNILLHHNCDKDECKHKYIIKKGVEIHRVVMIEGIGRGALRFYIDLELIYSHGKDGIIDIRDLLSKKDLDTPVSDFHLVLSPKSKQKIQERGVKEVTKLQNQRLLSYHLSNHLDKDTLYNLYLCDSLTTGLGYNKICFNCDSDYLYEYEYSNEFNYECPYCIKSKSNSDNKYFHYYDDDKSKLEKRRERFGYNMLDCDNYNSKERRFWRKKRFDFEDKEVQPTFSKNKDNIYDLKSLQQELGVIQSILAVKEHDDKLLQLYLEKYYITKKIKEYLSTF